MDPIAVTLGFVKATLVVLAALGLSATATGLGVALALRRFRHSAGRPWTERASAAYAARLVVARSALLNTLALAGVAFFRIAPGLGLPAQTLAAFTGLGAFTGSLAVGQHLERRLCETATSARRSSRRGIAVFWLLAFPQSVVFWLMLALMPRGWGWPAAGAVILGSLLVAGSLQGIWLIGLARLGLLRPASPRLWEVVERTAAKVGIPPRAIGELTSPNPNAIAWFVPRFVMFTSPLCEILDDEELAAITAHELGHLAEPRGVLLLRILSSFLPVVVAAAIPLGGTFGLTAGLVPVALLGIALVIMPRLGRRMEEHADRLAREFDDGSAVAYARALEKIHEGNLLPVVVPGRHEVHPHLYDRLVAAGAPSAYPRPAPPRRSVLGLLPAYLLALMCFGQVIWALVPDTRQARRYRPRTAAARTSLVQAAALARQAVKADRAGDLQTAAVLYQRATRLAPREYQHQAKLAAVLVRIGRYDEAEKALRIAELILRVQGRRSEVEKRLGDLRETIRAHQQPRAGEDSSSGTRTNDEQRDVAVPCG
jgi:Zn-dependent protease with chaperone function